MSTGEVRCGKGPAPGMMTADPQSSLLAICDFIGVPFEEGMLNYRSKVHHLTNGNRMRLSNSVQIDTDDNWAARLTVEDQRYFERTAGSLNRALGYS